jgi:predicted GNAT superfamily acetyltransferase
LAAYFKKEANEMWNGMDRAAIEAVLGKGIEWVDGADDSDVTYLMDKAIREGLTASEEAELHEVK